jgi:hypothetical protein
LETLTDKGSVLVADFVNAEGKEKGGGQCDNEHGFA